MTSSCRGQGVKPHRGGQEMGIQATLLVPTYLCEGRGCDRPARVRDTHPSWSRSAPRGETSGDPVDGAAFLRVEEEAEIGSTSVQEGLKHWGRSYGGRLPAAIRRSNQRAVLSKWFAISGSGPPSRSSSTKRSCRDEVRETGADIRLNQSTLNVSCKSKGHSMTLSPDLLIISWPLCAIMFFKWVYAHFTFILWIFTELKRLKMYFKSL